MPKPPSYSPKQLAGLIDAAKPAERLDAFVRLAPDGVPSFELGLELGSMVGGRTWRDSYDKEIGHGVPVMCSALELMPHLLAEDRGLALLQGLSGATAAPLQREPSFAGYPWDHNLDQNASATEMDESALEGRLTRFHGRLVPLINEETRRKFGQRYLYTRAVLDAAHDGHRQVLIASSLRMAEALRWRNSEQTLYTASHYFVHAAPDYEVAETLQGWLDGLDGPIRGDNRRRKPSLDDGDLATAVATVGGGDDGAVLELVRAEWGDGHSLEALLEPLFVVAGRALAAGGAAAVAGARAIELADAAAGSIPWLKGPDGVIAPGAGDVRTGRWC